MVTVPTLRQLRRDNGVSNLSPIDKLNLLTSNGVLQIRGGCVLCASEGGNSYEVVLECQKPQMAERSGLLTGAFVLFGGLWASLLHHSANRSATAVGEERILKFEIQLCSNCAGDKRLGRKLVPAIRQIPEVDAVYQEYPAAEAYLEL
ncbi:MAG: hypothetical protein Aurels2KO_38390 [Aureliella sp.]